MVSSDMRPGPCVPTGGRPDYQFVYEIDGDWGGELGVISLSAGAYMRMEPDS